MQLDTKIANRNIKIEHLAFKFDIMTAPKVFLSSTCYDLSIIRENLEKFIESLGYIPIRSERGSIYYETSKDVMDSCIDEVPNCQMLISIIGGRFGSEYKDTGKSITNMEVDKARETKVPIFTLVDNKVLQQYEVWKINKGKKISYPNVKSTKIFEFIEEVKNASVNNALQPFDTFEDIRSYLMQQWSGMMYSFLTSESKAKQVDETLSAISEVGNKIEFITRQIVNIVGTNTTDLKIKIMDLIAKDIELPLKQLLRNFGINDSPENIIKYNSLEKLLDANGIEWNYDQEIIEELGEEWICFADKNGKKSKTYEEGFFEVAKKNYEKLYIEISLILKQNKISKKEFLSKI